MMQEPQGRDLFSETTAQEIQLPPEGRFRQRSDGGVDDTYTLHFAGTLNSKEMRAVVNVLLAGVEEGQQFGVVALTLVEFINLNTCTFRLWCEDFRPVRLNHEFEILHRLDGIHEIQDVDGIRYPLRSRQK